MGQQGMWDWEQRHQKLDEQKSFLTQLDALIPWEEFRPLLQKVHEHPRKSNAGRKSFDVILKFKLVLLQRFYNISDAELEYQVNDRLSFMRFLKLGLEDTVPDATTIWRFREDLTRLEIIDELWEKFEYYLSIQGYKAQGGQIIDASFVPVPKQHNTKEENAEIKLGQVPQEWSKHKVKQKDIDARWTKKNNVSHFGYKNNICIDVKYGFIRRYKVTDAAVHDSQTLGEVLDIENEADEVWADSAYRGEDTEWVLAKMGFKSEIHERVYRNRPLSDEQKARNKEKSKTRAYVEHVFGHWVNEMGGKLMRGIGKARIAVKIGLVNLSYNLKRYIYLQTAEVV